VTERVTPFLFAIGEGASKFLLPLAMEPAARPRASDREIRKKGLPAWPQGIAKGAMLVKRPHLASEAVFASG